ncbi:MULTISPECIES: 8-oxo-dGTP diphosphatase MutT [unclassified Marinobacterium]|uniref:8-oxo-dGTP diphosphatase MutT n=1 Tax=unclassified Marinobacterium TaxID=2644139 RepID=UPI001569DBE5|nr:MULTISPECIES: 8-oxo-dGTP diphosphatase MutT [unclassified Marinobacterium]NRP52869.1 8-oxo-dGTP diphosphatase [Marinobacterium sp. xm-v-242]NRP77450.1 8-oxo-dGTP diphosphatase [Marinobacterium sp. xm-m-383]
MKQILVAAAAILNPQGQLLIAKRPDDKHQGGLWEFPGGKVETDETVETALKRELLEEIGIEIVKCEPLVRIEHDYSDKSVVLDVWVVSSFSGEASGLEGQPIEWINPVEMDSYQFPEANLPIIAALKTRLGL